MRFRSNAVALCLLETLLVACGSDETNTSATPAEPPRLEILAIAASGGHEYEPGASEPLVIGCDRSVVVTLGADGSAVIPNWTLRGPNACGSSVQCGFVTVRVEAADGSVETEASSVLTSVPVQLGELADTAGSSHFVAQLMNDDNTPFELDDGSTVSAALDVPLAPGCNTAGAGGSAGTAGAAGAGGTAGTSTAGAGGTAGTSTAGAGGTAGTSTAGAGGTAGTAGAP